MASAWISKKSAARYVQDYVSKYQKNNPPPFTPPVQVQVLNASSATYEPLDAINGGEDSLFHSRLNHNLTFGVCDGVGGWNESGIDPSIFSRSLTAYLSAMAQRTFLLHESDEIEPQDTLGQAFAAMRMDSVPAYGSATALAMNLSMATGMLRSAQLGDSTYVVLRDAKERFVSAEQQHRFNMPYQLTIPPTDDPMAKKEEDKEGAPFYRPRPVDDLSKSERDELRRQIEADDFADLSAVGFDTPRDARVDSHQLQHNDVVVAATDGLFDNVRVDEIERLTERFQHGIKKNSKASPLDLFGGLAYSVAAQAVTNYIQPDLRSPFAERAKVAGHNFAGGKPDDVTVVLAWLKDSCFKAKL